MRRVVIQDLCDICSDDTAGDLLNPAYSTLNLSVNPDELPTLRLDVCENHWKSYDIDKLMEATKPLEPEVDRPPLAKRGRPKGPCPVCGKEYALGSGMTLHVLKQHPEHDEALPTATYVHPPGDYPHESKKRKKARCSKR